MLNGNARHGVSFHEVPRGGGPPNHNEWQPEMPIPRDPSRGGTMCFSATGSFAVAGLILAVGAATIDRNVHPPLRMFAAIPVLFAAQQVAEGTVWLSRDGALPGLVQVLAVYVFLGVALAIWPVWMPLSLWMAERDPRRRRTLGALLGLGVMVSIAALFVLTRWQPTATVEGHSIRYHFAGTSDTWIKALLLVAYTLATVAPLYVSTVRLTRVIGAALMVSLIASILIQRNVLTSVWCFFAAIVSVLFFLAVAREGERPATAVRLEVERIE